MISGKVSVSQRLQNGHWKSLQTASVSGALACPINGLPSVFTFLISTVGAVPACGEPVEPVEGFDPLHLTAPAMKSPPTMTAIGKRYLLPVSLFVSISEDDTIGSYESCHT